MFNVSVVNFILVGVFHSSKALSSYRQIRRKYREQVWRLEQKVAAMTESQHQNGAPKSEGEALEWRREETVLWSCDSLGRETAFVIIKLVFF